MPCKLSTKLFVKVFLDPPMLLSNRVFGELLGWPDNPWPDSCLLSIDFDILALFDL